MELNEGRMCAPRTTHSTLSWSQKQRYINPVAARVCGLYLPCTLDSHPFHHQSVICDLTPLEKGFPGTTPCLRHIPNTRGRARCQHHHQKGTTTSMRSLPKTRGATIRPPPPPTSPLAEMQQAEQKTTKMTGH